MKKQVFHHGIVIFEQEAFFMRYYLLIFIILISSFYALSQNSIEATLEQFNSGTIPYITISELKKDTVSIKLDTRKMEEYQVSHIESALWVGFDEFDLAKVREQIPDSNTPIVVYCSIGVRSEQIGEKLQAAGYTNVKNLYGGIFQWKGEGEKVVDSSGLSTERVHAFSKLWGKLLTNAQKVY